LIDISLEVRRTEMKKAEQKKKIAEGNEDNDREEAFIVIQK
jgi:hypothetical protein